MKLKTELDIKNLIKNDSEMMRILKVARDFNLPDWWISAGFLRNKIWDEITGLSKSEMTDIDLVYFDKENVQPETDWEYDKKLLKIYPSVNWEVKNQARMHLKNNDEPYSSSEDSIAHYPETATAVAVKLVGNGIKLIYCYGLDDILNLISRPTPYFTDKKYPVFVKRMSDKQWQNRWPNLTIIEK